MPTSRHHIDFNHSFDLRRKVLDAAGIDYTINAAGELELERELPTYSHREKLLIEFAVNPMKGLGEHLMGLDPGPSRAFIDVLNAVYDASGKPKWEK